MAEYTNNYNLKKPADDDFYDVQDFNANADIVDAELKKQANRIGATENPTFTEAAELSNISTGDSLSTLFSKIKKAISNFISHMSAGNPHTDSAPVKHRHTLTDIDETSASKIMTAEERTKLQGVAANANNYTLPKATNDTLGGIIPGRSLSVDENGKLSVAFAGTESINVAQVAATKSILKELSGVSPVPTGSSLSGNYTSHYLDGDGLSFRNADANNTDFTVYGRNGITTMDYNAVKNTLVTLGLNTVLADLAHCYYSDGEKVTFYVNTSFAGFTGIERKYAHFFIPLNKSLDFVKSVSFSGKVTLRGVGGLLGGAEEFDLSSASKNTGVQQISAVFSSGGLRCSILFSNVITNSTANTPISVAPHGGNLVLTFSSQ